MYRRYCSILISAALAAGPLPAAGEEGILSLDKVLEMAEVSNPEILAARKAWEAARARVAPARTWPDPMLSASREKFPDGEKMNHLMAEQEIPFPGKLHAEGKMKAHEARIAEAHYRAKALQVRAEAKILYYRLFRADRLIGKLAQSVEVMKAMLRTAQSRLQSGGSQGSKGQTSLQAAGGMGQAPSMSGGSGRGMGADVFALMAELGRMENMLFEQKQERALAALELNALLDRDPETPVGKASAPALVDLPFTRTELVKLTRQNDPLYLASLHEQKHARSMLARARLGFAPDLSVAYDRMTDPMGGKGSEATVGLRLPLWFSRPRGELKEAKAHVEETEAAAQAMRNEAVKMVGMEFTEVNTHLTMARNFETTIAPAAESALNLTRRQYESGSGDFVRLLESVRSHIAAQMDYTNELYHFGEHWALLEQWVGVPLSSKSQEKKP